MEERQGDSGKEMGGVERKKGKKWIMKAEKGEEEERWKERKSMVI